MRIFFSVGEPSGDLHGANLIRELRSQRDGAEFVGFGGPKMAAAGCHLLEDLTLHAVMGIFRALAKIPLAIRLLLAAGREFRRCRPDAVVLIDYPGFNWWVARVAKRHGIPVFYYGAPQLWAWGSWRVRRVRRYVDHLLCKLPFEEDWFRSRGCNATYVGHPFFDEVRRHRNDEAFLAQQRKRPGQLVTILPGSRNHEVEYNLHWFLRAARIIHCRAPLARFAIAAFSQQHAEKARSIAARTEELDGLQIDIYHGKTPELIQAADCCLAVSGSVSLELLYHTKPTVILYWVTSFGWFLQWLLVRVRYITLVNLLTAKKLYRDDRQPYEPTDPDAERVLFPEYVTHDDRSADMAQHVIGWLTFPPQAALIRERLEALKSEVAAGGASQRAAHYIVDQLDQFDARPRRPHFLPRKDAQRRDEQEAA